MSYSFPPVYQPFIQLWSPFSRIEPISEVYNEKVEKIDETKATTDETLTLYNRRGELVEYSYVKHNRSG